MPSHGTRWAYAGGCTCPECVEAASSYFAEFREVNQERTALARNHSAPWTAEDDAHLLHGPGTVLDRAMTLHRTYYACVARLARLRADMHQEALTH